MKGSLHTDELMRAVTASKTGLRTARRISHVFIMDVPTYPETLFITDAAINIFPDLDAKRDIIQNAIDLFTRSVSARREWRSLSAVETVTSKIPSTIEAAALCKMADRKQITGGILDGPLAFDNAIDPEAARIKGIESPVAGKAQILVVPDLEAGNMLAKNLIFLIESGLGRYRARRQSAGGADVARGFGAKPHGVVRCRCTLCRRSPRVAPIGPRCSRPWTPFSSSTQARPALNSKFLSIRARQTKCLCQRTGRWHRDAAAFARRATQEERRLIDRKYEPEEISSVGVSDSRRWRLAAQQPEHSTLAAVGHRVVHGGPDYDRPVRVDREVLARLEQYCPLAPLHQPNNLAPIRTLLDRNPDLPQVACFDTAFHRSHGPLADRYAIPEAALSRRCAPLRIPWAVL